MSLHLILGCMFSGKTTEIIRIVRRYRALHTYQSNPHGILVINYSQDTRYLTDTNPENHQMMTHNLEGEPALPLDNLAGIDPERYSQATVIAINEGQFFGRLVSFCRKALEDDKIIIVGGLDGDYQQQPFGELLQLIPLADKISRLHAFCQVCGDGTPAFFTRRTVENITCQKLIGGAESYQPVCRKHLLGK